MAGGLLAPPLAAEGQEGRKGPRIGVLWPPAPRRSPPRGRRGGRSTGSYFSGPPPPPHLIGSDEALATSATRRDGTSISNTDGPKADSDSSPSWPPSWCASRSTSS